MGPNTSLQTLHPSIKLNDLSYSSDEEFDVDYLCPSCENPRINDRWCKYCESKRLSENFPNWTSNNEILDEFIRDTQRNATKNQDYLVWIDYDKLEKVTYLTKGGFSDVYRAVWVEGPERKLVRDEIGEWHVQARTPVVLKCLHNSENLSMNLLNELKAHYKCRNGRVLRCYGITQNKETKKYMLVMKYANEGDLRHYLTHNNSKLTWREKLSMLKDIALGLEEIHSVKLLHRDFHSGNILHHTPTSDKMQTYVTDLGLCRPVNQSLTEEREIYGVLPFIAPEILRNTHDYSEASDIYSFGMIMWEVLHGKPPFCDVPHDASLVLKICDGYRPKTKKKGVPEWYISLMDICWNTDPSKRRDICEVRKIIASKYLTEVHGGDDVPLPRTNVRGVRHKSQTPSQAIFTSRLLEVPKQRDVPAEKNNESSHAYSKFESIFDDSETELSHAGSKSEYSSNNYYSNDEEQDEADNQIEEDSKEFVYNTRAFDETLSVEDLIKGIQSQSSLQSVTKTSTNNIE